MPQSQWTDEQRNEYKDALFEIAYVAMTMQGVYKTFGQVDHLDTTQLRHMVASLGGNIHKLIGEVDSLRRLHVELTAQGQEQEQKQI